MLSPIETSGERLPLTKEESAFLRHIYKKRLKLFALTYLFLIIVAFGSALAVDGPSDRYGRRMYSYRSKETGLSREQMYAITIPLLETFVIVSGVVFFRKRIWQIRKDIKNNLKEPIYYTVVQKNVYEHTGQYFVGLNHPDYLFHEVDFDVWKNIVVGEPFVVFRAPLSKQAFNANGTFKIF